MTIPIIVTTVFPSPTAVPGGQTRAIIKGGKVVGCVVVYDAGIGAPPLKDCTFGPASNPSTFTAKPITAFNPPLIEGVVDGGTIIGCATFNNVSDAATVSWGTCTGKIEFYLESSTSKPPSSTGQSSSPSSVSTADINTSQTASPGSPVETESASPSTTVETESASASTTIPTNSAPVAHVKTGASGGAVAGTAIGCLLAGALIAFLACFFLYRRQNRKQHPASFPSHLPYDSEDKTGVAAPVPAAGSRNIDSLLPQPVEDDAITKELSKIRDNIKNHVQAYYHFQPVHANVNISRLAEVATATNMSTATLAGLLSSPTTRSDAIRLFIAWAVLSKSYSGGHQSLLPAELAPLLETIPGKDRSDTADSALFSNWKVLTGALLEQKYGGKAPASNGQVQNRANIIELIDAVLSPFLKAGVDLGKRRDNLDMILARAAKLGFVLFSQPGSFHLDFVGGHTADALVVFPALLQVVGDQAQVLNRPRTLWEKEYAAPETSGYVA